MKTTNYWILAILVMACLGKSTVLDAQCTGGSNAGAISPTTSFQTIPCVFAGQCYTFNAVAGATYVFSFCQGGGSAPFGFDTYLTILDNSGTAIPGAFNDNFCFPIFSEVTWIAPVSATFRILITLPAPGCGSNAICGTMAYRRTNPPGPGSSCSNSMVIAALPYANSGLTTCGNGNTYTSAHACGSTYMNGEDFIFSYNSPGNECIDLALTGTTNWVGLFVFNGCPNVVGTNCVAQGTSGSGNPSLAGVQLTAAGTYYFLVSTLPPPNCTPFNISITRCPTGTTCAYSREIPSLPYSQNGLTTCGFGNDYTSANACASAYLNGEDFVFSYNATSPQCIDIFTSGTSNWAGVFVLDGCPNAPGTNCIDQNVSIFGNPTLIGTYLPSAGTYYFIVDTKPLPNCTPFNILVDTCRPPAPCGTNPPSTDLCNGATNISTYSTFCGTTDTLVYDVDGPGNLLSTFCGTIENNGWWSFVADTTVIHFYFDVYNCYFGNGVQAQVLSTNDCTNFTTVSNCFNPGSQSNGTLTATGLVVGQTYYLMVDGYAQDDCDYNVTWDGGPLPVEFGSMSAIAVDGEVHLNWETLQEHNCKQFTIQRGLPDEGRERNDFAWSDLGMISGSNNSSATRTYVFVDQEPATLEGYYRIKEDDFNGFSSYSPILHVAQAAPERNALLEIYPNPADDILNLTLGFGLAGNARLQLFDVSGKVVQIFELGHFAVGTHATSIDLPNLKPGVYFYDLLIGADNVRGKLLITH